MVLVDRDLKKTASGNIFAVFERTSSRCSVWCVSRSEANTALRQRPSDCDGINAATEA